MHVFFGAVRMNRPTASPQAGGESRYNIRVIPLFRTWHKRNAPTEMAKSVLESRGASVVYRQHVSFMPLVFGAQFGIVAPILIQSANGWPQRRCTGRSKNPHV